MLPPDFVTEPDARAADTQFAALTGVVNLDRKLRANPAMAARFERGLGRVVTCAYREASALECAHRFAQRALYRVSRLGLFWYDDLRRYTNERSPYLMAVRDRIERAWHAAALRRLEAPRATR